MEINKITFESFKTNEITKSFEDLDINGDGKITTDDLSATKDTALKAQIQSLINAADEEPALEKAGATKNKYGVNNTDAANFDQDIANSKGTVYLVMGSLSGCGRCVSLENKIKDKLSEIEAKAQVFNIDWNENRDKCWELYKSIAGNKSSVGFPVVLKFVDGKLTELISEGSANYDNVVQTMIDKAEGTSGTAATDETDGTKAGGTDATKAGSTSTKTAEDIKKAAEELLTKYPAEAATGTVDGYSGSNPELQALKKALDDGAIDALAKEGFSRIDIVDIISQAYPSVGIKKNDKGGYDCPIGHGEDAKAIYDLFTEQLGNVTSPNTELIAKIKDLNVQINLNNAKLNELKGTIALVQAEVQKLVEDAIKESEDIKEDQKEESAKIVREELSQYASSEGTMTYATFQKNVSDRLDSLEGDGSSKLSGVVIKLLNAEARMGTLKGYIETFGKLVDENSALAKEIEGLQEAATEESSEKCEASRCDPIGFSVNGKRYDFFVDSDGNNDLTNEQEFLGAKNGWSEMKALDTDGDGKVSQAEMKDLKLVTTDDDGNQVIKNASEVFGETDSIDLNSYKSVNQDFTNGNTLLGTFSLTVNGQEVNDAYNTMDTLDWLDENYEFTDEAAGTGRFAKENTTAEEVLDFSKELDEFKTTQTKLEEDLTSTWLKVGITRTDVADLIQDAEKTADGEKAKEIEELFKKKAKEGSTPATTDETPAATDETPAATDETPAATEE